jgi:amidophosphoribosyltransferase
LCSLLTYNYRQMADLNEKCAVTGIVGSEEVHAAALAYDTLFAMQHRGSEASGITSQPTDDRMQTHRAPGMVLDVYDQTAITGLAGNVATGHNRYSTSGSKTAHLQPIIDEPLGFSFAHNGNLPETRYLDTFLEHHNLNTRYMNDSERAAAAIALYMRSGHALPDAVELAYPLFRGAFSCVAMHDGLVVAFRDPKGIRPLAYGTFDDGHVVASETCALDTIGALYQREVQPGEMLIMTPDSVTSRQLADPNSKLDMFEFAYFARPDSLLYGQVVNEVRRRFGEQLAEEHPGLAELENPLVVPVPDTSVPAAEGFATTLGLPLTMAIVKNRFIGRTFMQPDQAARTSQLRRKHNIIGPAVEGRDLIVIDDSIVRLNTIPRLVEIARRAGARSVSVLIASPPVRFPDFYGIDTPSQKNLAAANMTVEQMRQRIDTRYLGYLSLWRMVAATGRSAEDFNLSCFNGEYPIGIGHRKKEVTVPVSMEYVN